jgi:deoxycytidylate deaminase/adenylylsulfate kinase-like enzyme
MFRKHLKVNEPLIEPRSESNWWIVAFCTSLVYLQIKAAALMDESLEMDNYFQDTISKIYGDDDDFVVIGLTGRTGSGCSTVANILSSKKEHIRHSLFSGHNPKDNIQRKQKIVFKCFEHNWTPFITIQASTVLLLMLSEVSIEDAGIFIGRSGNLESNIAKKTTDILRSIQNEPLCVDDINSLRRFYTEFLPEKNSELKTVMSGAAYVKLFQLIGNNLRNSGSVNSSHVVSGKLFSLAERINNIIKEIRKARSVGDKTFIVIDAIRNPFEAIYFQDRYSSFYLMAVSCNDDERKRRLRGLGYTDVQIDVVDNEEYGKSDATNQKSYIKQDIKACLQRADLHVSNPDSGNMVSNFNSLADQLLTFVALMVRPGLVTPTPLERCMQMAYTAKLNSGCISRQVGAVVTDVNFSVQSVGWNDTPFGQVPCSLRNRFDLTNGYDQEAYSEYEKLDVKFISAVIKEGDKFVKVAKTGRNISYCFKDEYNRLTGKDNQVHTRSLHAEENAFLQIAKYGGRGVEDGKLFTTASPCELCSKKAYQLGIKEIYYIDPYPGIAMSHILMGGSKNPKLVIFSGAIGRAFHNLYSPKLSFKDELKALSL